MPRVHFERDGCLEQVAEDSTLLEVALSAGIPLAHACGGAARCSTCRVAVLDGEGLSEPGRPEQALREAKGLSTDIRLACQARVCGDVHVRRLVMDSHDMSLVQTERGGGSGIERRVAVLFSDVRDFTTLSEKSLPYDVVHILNRYFQAMGDAVLAHHGLIDKYMGDGLMALFGHTEERSEQACADAVSAALSMQERLACFNRYLQANFDLQFRIGIGIHYGEVILGEMGHPDKQQFSAIGDTVNFASRVESYCKEAGASILVSEAVRQRAKEHTYGRSFEASLKGKAGTHKLHEVLDAAKEESVSEK